MESSALAISRVITERHLPFHTVIDPIFRAPDSDEIVAYTRAGDSAIWTGHYLAAEAFRYAVTGSPEAFANINRALEGIRLLVETTGGRLLARAAIPSDSPFAAGIFQEEASHLIWPGQLEGFQWIGNTSRDQYLGVFFGLSVAYELLNFESLRVTVRDLATRMLDFLLDNHWNVVMPQGGSSTTFGARPDQMLAMLQIGRQVNPDRFADRYSRERLLQSRFVILPITVEVLDDHSSYFKFNLDAISLFSLVRLEGAGGHRDAYFDAYNVLRRTTDDHGNAHFNMIDRALKGPDARRDAETVELLTAWLRRPRRDEFVDLRATIAACGENRACRPIPVAERVRTDFLWQRSPFQLSGGGDGFIETAGIDFILPFWMARFYGVV
jgi:hypothetical protein